LKQRTDNRLYLDLRPGRFLSRSEAALRLISEGLLPKRLAISHVAESRKSFRSTLSCLGVQPDFSLLPIPISRSCRWTETSERFSIPASTTPVVAGYLLLRIAISCFVNGPCLYVLFAILVPPNERFLILSAEALSQAEPVLLTQKKMSIDNP
jgi:hypothetical protein